MTLKTGAVLCFVGGMIEIRQASHKHPGSGRLSFSDDDLGYGENGERTLNLPPGELASIRDFLNKHFPEETISEAVAEARGTSEPPTGKVSFA